jgi:hypothetical protein
LNWRSVGTPTKPEQLPIACQTRERLVNRCARPQVQKDFWRKQHALWLGFRLREYVLGEWTHFLIAQKITVVFEPKRLLNNQSHKNGSM